MKLIKKLTIKIYPPAGRPIIHLHSCPPNYHYNAEGIDKILDREAEEIEKEFPMYEFKLVPLRGGQTFVFAFVKEKEEEIKSFPEPTNAGDITVETLIQGYADDMRRHEKSSNGTPEILI